MAINKQITDKLFHYFNLFFLGFVILYIELVAPVFLNANFIPTNSYIVLFITLIAFFTASKMARHSRKLYNFWLKYPFINIVIVSIIALVLPEIYPAHLFGRIFFFIPLTVLAANIIFHMSKENIFFSICCYSAGMFFSALFFSTLLSSLGPMNVLFMVFGVWLFIRLLLQKDNFKMQLFGFCLFLAFVFIFPKGYLAFKYGFIFKNMILVPIFLGFTLLCFFVFDIKSTILISLNILLCLYYPFDTNFSPLSQSDTTFSHYLTQNLEFFNLMKEKPAFHDLDSYKYNYPLCYRIKEDKWNIFGRTTIVNKTPFIDKADPANDIKEFLIDTDTETSTEIESKYFKQKSIFHNKIPWYPLNYVVEKEWIFLLAQLAPNTEKIFELGSGTCLNTLALAKYFPKANITSLEFNPRIVQYLKEFSDSNFHQVPKESFNLVNAEGRKYLSTRKVKNYDLIVLDFADTMQFSPLFPCFMESYLYTEEAFELYYKSLSEKGVLFIGSHLTNITKHAFQILRMLVTLDASLGEMLDVKKHVLIVQCKESSAMAYMLFFKDKEVLKNVTDKAPFLKDYNVLYAPFNDKQDNFFTKYLQADSATKKILIENYPLNIIPIDDHTPFLYNVLKNKMMMQSIFYFLAVVFIIVCSCEWLLPDLRKIKDKDFYIFLSFFTFSSSFLQIYLFNQIFISLGSPVLAISFGISIYYFFQGMGSYFHQGKALKIIFYTFLLTVLAQLILGNLFFAFLSLIQVGFIYGTIFARALNNSYKVSNNLGISFWIYSSLFSAVGIIIAYAMFVIVGDYYNLAIGMLMLVYLLYSRLVKYS